MIYQFFLSDNCRWNNHLYLDIDECCTSIPCHDKAKCVNTEGGYYCQCKQGKIMYLINVIKFVNTCGIKSVTTNLI